jgi:hypothetical protein
LKKSESNVRVITSASSVVAVGNDLFVITPTSDGRGVRLENGTDSIFIPAGEAGDAIVKAVRTSLPANAPVKRTPRVAKATAENKPKRVRRSAEEIARLREAGEIGPKRVYSKPTA